MSEPTVIAVAHRGIAMFAHDDTKRDHPAAVWPDLDAYEEWLRGQLLSTQTMRVQEWK